MSSQWIPYAEPTGSEWDLLPREIFGFITEGLLTPYDEDCAPLFPEKFLTVQQKANTLPEPKIIERGNLTPLPSSSILRGTWRLLNLAERIGSPCSMRQLNRKRLEIGTRRND